MDPAKLARIANWSALTIVKQTRFFLGFVNFYQRFINQYSDLAQPLSKLTQKDRLFKWGKKQEAAFVIMKKVFLDVPVLIMPDLTKPFIVEANASKWVMGAILKQQDSKTGIGTPVDIF